MPLWLLANSSALPDAEAIRDTARQVLSRPDYTLEADPVNQLYLFELFLRFLQWVVRPFRWFFDVLEEIHPALAWLFILVLVAILIALIWHIIYTFRTALSRRVNRTRYGQDEPVRAVPPEEWERRAEEALAAGDFIGAVRLLFRACLVRLEGVEKRPFRRGLTNREHLRRYRDTSLFEPLARMVETIDLKWYGDGRCGPDDVESCRMAYARVRSHLGEAAHGHSA